MEKILVVEDEWAIATLLKFNLEKEGYQVNIVGDGLEALELIRSEKPDFILLDLMLPGMDGLDICKNLRSGRINTPIIVITAKDDLLDKVLSLELGADDFVTKPFNTRELVARIKAIQRRTKIAVHYHSEIPEDTFVSVGPFRISTDNYEAYLRDDRIELTRREFELLHYLAINNGRVMTRDQLLMEIWSHENSGDSRIVDVHVSHLRDKIEKNPKQPQFIKTVRGKGYKFDI